MHSSRLTSDSLQSVYNTGCSVKVEVCVRSQQEAHDADSSDTHTSTRHLTVSNNPAGQPEIIVDGIQKLESSQRCLPYTASAVESLAHAKTVTGVAEASIPVAMLKFSCVDKVRVSVSVGPAEKGLWRLSGLKLQPKLFSHAGIQSQNT